VNATRFWSDPFGSASQAGTPLVLVPLLILMPAALVVGVVAVVVRFARSAGEERLQLKWFAAAAVLVVATFIASIFVNSVAVDVVQNVAFLCQWAAIGIAVLKYRLYEIDIVIGKAVLYGLWVPIMPSPHATWEYSWIRPPSRSRLRTRILSLAGATGILLSGGLWLRARCGRWVL
jgi:hypothetical protein